MPGSSDYLAQNTLNFLSGNAPMPSIGNRFLALFTTFPTGNSGSGGVEVSGTGYAREQIAGAITAAGAISTAAATITMPNVSGYSWVVPGMNVYDLTNSKQVGTVLSWTATTLTLTGNASNAGSGSTDSLQFSAFPAATASVGTEPAGVTPAYVSNSSAIIAFPQSTATWGTIVGWGVYDALTAGNYLLGDWLGLYKWLPFSCTLASPGVLTAVAHGFANSDPVVVTSKFGGTLPTGTWTGVLTVASSTTDTFAAGVNTSSTGNGMVRKIVQQSIPANITPSFSASQLTLSLA